MASTERGQSIAGSGRNAVYWWHRKLHLTMTPEALSGGRSKRNS
jgi:hypothetical protein